MKPAAFFARLRVKVVALRDAGRPLVDAFYVWHSTEDNEPRAALEHGNGRIARLDELMTQAALGADIPITPGPTARNVWLREAVEYGTRVGSTRMHRADTEVTSHGTPLRTPKAGGRSRSRRSPASKMVSSESSRWITDLFGLVEDWLVHLETQALAASQQARHAQTEVASTDWEREKPLSKKERVDAYIQQVRRQPGRRTFSRKDIWTGARYRDPTEFQRWQRDDPRTTPTAQQRFDRILREKPHLHKLK
jgi:hypothetical protein